MKNPGINGWVQNTPTSRGGCNYYLDVNSKASGRTPDGAPFGLYLYDVEPEAVVFGATLTYWILGSHPASGAGSVTWVTRGTHSIAWVGPGRGTPQEKVDGSIYTPYTWTIRRR